MKAETNVIYEEKYKTFRIRLIKKKNTVNALSIFLGVDLDKEVSSRELTDYSILFFFYSCQICMWVSAVCVSS